MDEQTYTLDRLVVELREARACAHDDDEMLRLALPIAGRAAAHRADWLRDEMARPDPQQGFGFHLLHEEDDHSLAVFVASWLRGRGTPPHDHGTWALVAGLAGCERNATWRRVDDGSRAGYAELEKTGERSIAAGDIVAMQRGAIHSVRNDGEGTSVSLHIYGHHVNHTDRSQFDPERRTHSPYKVVTSSHAPACAPRSAASATTHVVAPVLIAAALASMLALPGASQERAEPMSAAYLAASCTNCHGTEGRSAGAMPSLAGLPEDYIAQRMKQFRAGVEPVTVMQQIAKGYSDEQTAALAAYFSRQPSQPRKVAP